MLEIGDRISELPVEVLHQILILLDSKEVARTCVLSKRWNYLWTSIPILDFPGDETLRTELFLSFIDNIFHHRQENYPITKFRVYSDVYIDSLSSWLSYLVSHRIRHLDVVFHVPFHPDFSVPSSLFTCDCLKVFKFEMLCNFKLPTSSTISFPMLRTLSLKLVKFFHNCEQIFSSCPVLQHLQIIHCEYKNIDTINISAPMLMTLFIEEKERYPKYSGMANCEIRVFAPNLKRLEYLGYLPKKLNLCDLPFVTHATVDFYLDNRPDNHQLALKFLEKLPNVEVLTIGSNIVYGLFEDQILIPHLPTFEYLTSFTFKWDSSIRFYSKTMLDMLQTMPCLENLYIYNFISVEYEYHTPTETSLPQCLLSSLKHVEMNDISGEECGELNAVAFFFKYAKVLKKMIITPSDCHEENLQEMISDRIKEIGISSPRFIVEFRTK